MLVKVTTLVRVRLYTGIFAVYVKKKRVKSYAESVTKFLRDAYKIRSEMYADFVKTRFIESSYPSLKSFLEMEFLLLKWHQLSRRIPKSIHLGISQLW